MAALPEPEHTTLRAIERAVEAEASPDFRAHLGASILGRKCERELWYSFRWATVRRHPARILRLFARGQREEAVLVDLLRKAGVTVHEVDPETGEQFRCSAIGGHLGGSMDGAGVGFVEAPEKWHALEFKTHNDRSFKALLKDGVLKAKPEHHAQMMVYMHLFGLDRAYYLAVNKNDDSLYAERVRHSVQAGDALIAKAERIIASDRPLPKLSDDPGWYECKFCDHHALCHGQAVPPPTCRTCMHATPELDGNARWSCAYHQTDRSEQEQLHGCEAHAYIPDLLANWAEPTDAIGANVEYLNRLNGQQFFNGPGVDIGADAYASAELYAAKDLAVIGSTPADAVREAFGGRVVG